MKYCFHANQTIFAMYSCGFSLLLLLFCFPSFLSRLFSFLPFFLFLQTVRTQLFPDHNTSPPRLNLTNIIIEILPSVNFIFLLFTFLVFLLFHFLLFISYQHLSRFHYVHAFFLLFLFLELLMHYVPIHPFLQH